MPQSDRDKRITISVKIREEDVTSQAQLKDISKFMKQFLHEPPVQRFETRDRITTPSVPVKRRRVVEFLTFAAAENITRKLKFEIDN